MSDIKQVKVDNWGIYFLQRLKHFFNRTDYCDLTLQFQDNAQLKVHRLVLSACTEYFELLERTCEMYEDCLIMPDDLQADVVVPIVNFMYTGQLEFKADILEKLYQTSQIMNMPVLTKLLNSHRVLKVKASQKYSTIKRYSKPLESKSVKQSPSVPSTSIKRSYSTAFEANNSKYKDQTVYINKPESKTSNIYRPPSPTQMDLTSTPKRLVPVDPRPTRYELPEELDTDNVFDNSFTNISYGSQPLMVHPETVKQYSSKRAGMLNDSKRSRKVERLSTVDIVECKKVAVNNSNIFDDSILDNITDTEVYQSPFVKTDSAKISNQLFDQILDNNDGPKVTIETKDGKSANNMDHAKIISEVLKKYPHLVKSNKVIKLKVLNSTNKSTPRKQVTPKYKESAKVKAESEPDFTYEVDVLDSKEAAKLIALGAENIKGPWICLICGTPGKALHFTSYYKFRRHLVDIHNEKPVMNICEYCGMKSAKRNCLLHHLYSKHGVEPPPSHHFPKCNQCSYIGLTEALLVRHKLSHLEGRHFRCNVCDEVFSTSNQLLQHIQTTGHKYSAERKTNLQCIYCLKVFLRQTNLYAHLKSNHREEAKRDGIIDDSDDEKEAKNVDMKLEPSASFSNEYDEVDIQYKIQQRPDGNIQLVPKKQSQQDTPSKQKILNSDFSMSKPVRTEKMKDSPSKSKDFLQNMPINSNNEEEIVMIDNDEYIVRDNLLIPRHKLIHENEEYNMIPNLLESTPDHAIQTATPTTSMEYTSIHTTTVDGNIQQPNMIINNSSNMNQPIQIVVSNEEEYKALISSNHPIIFDNGEASKALTVLTAPHATSLGTIDMNNTQTNDMMIIQDNYPLNVSEAVSTDNSNIVVVYSHHINQDKPFQLLTPEGVDEQYVQSSTIITQNYETITTTTPVMSAHVLETPVTETWQQNTNHQPVQNEQIHMHTDTEMHTIQQEEPQTEDANTHLSELPEVHLQLSAAKSTEEVVNTDESNLNQNNDMIIVQNLEEIEQDQNVENPTNTSAMEIDQSLDDSVEKKDENVEPTECSDIANIPQVSSNIDSAMVEMPSNECETEQTSAVTEEPQECLEDPSVDVQNSDTKTVTDVQTINESVNEMEQTDLPENENATFSETIINQPEPSQEAVKKIEAYTSEWSEDEYDTVTSEPNKENGTTSQDESMQENVKQSETLVAVIPCVQPEVVESIENIQQEIENQMAVITSAAPDIDESSDSSPLKDDNLTMSKELTTQAETNGKVEAPQENISSILNDWDDNDSQENDSRTDDAETDAVPEAQPVETNNSATENSVPQKSDTKPDVKSLVSDWDDDDEEETKT